MKKCPKCEKTYEDTTTLCPSDGAVLEKDGGGLIGQTLADKYRVEELISQGGMGTVYRGTHILMDKTVAIKVLNPSLAADDVIVQRFSREARAASRISHPHALNVTDFGESQNGVVFLIMEYLRGKTLKEVVQGEGRLDLPRVTEIIRQVCGALDAAHAEGVVHRDLKSDNIMLVDVGGGDWAKVLDFGIAKIKEPVGTQDSALTLPNLIIGTPQYMSPEQCAQASELDARSDIYSLGVILYEMLAGHVPFMGESPTAIMMKHLQEPAPPLLDERKDVPAAVGRVVARALAKRPEERFQSAGELSEALNKAAEMPASAAVAAADTSASAEDRATNRIVVPTDSNEMVRNTTSEEQDESTIVRQRPVGEEPVESEEVIFQDVSAPPVDTFNPWRIIVPAIVGLVIVFGVIYALTRNSNPQPANQQNAPLVVDPNSSPVQPMQSPTGQAEQGVASSTTTNTNQNSNSATGGAGQTQTSNSSSTGANSNAAGDKTPPRNENSAQPEPTPSDDNANTAQPEPTPKPTETPAVDVDEPPPMPKPKKKPPRELPKPELPAETPASPPLGDAPTAP